MKLPLLTTIAALLSFAGLRADENFIMQEVVVNGQTLQYKIPLQNTQGEVVSNPVDADGSVFRLYTVYTDTNKQLKTLLLDTQTLGTYMPAATLVIKSQDSHLPARTRADEPYGVSTKVTGLTLDPNAPSKGRAVRVVRSYKLYDPQTMAADPKDKGTDYANPFVLETNNTFSLTDGNSAGGFLPRLDIVENPDSRLTGEETYTVYAGANGNGGDTLAMASIQIWPVADAEFFEIERNKIYQALPANSAIQCNNLYPGCLIYAQIYKGLPGSPESEKKRIPSAVLQYSADTREPQTQRFPLNDLDQFISKDGKYTIEIMTVTPFNGGQPELVDGGSLTFEVKRDLHVRAAVYTME